MSDRRSSSTLAAVGLTAAAALSATQQTIGFTASSANGGQVQPAQASLRGSSAAATSSPANMPVGEATAPASDASSSLGWRPLVAGAVAMTAIGVQKRRGANQQPRNTSSVVACRATAPAGGYCEAVEKCVRRPTRTVHIGDVKVGSEHRVATQTMTTTPTNDVEATVAQIKSCADAGVDIVRVTVQGMTEARACEKIKKQLLEDGYTTPIVADIHFTPKVALVVADHVDKVRVNPGNFTDGRKSFDTISELTEEDIAEAKADIAESFVPLVLKLKEKGKALRIGVNHGSLSERILFQYGDSPEGMVASAVEFGEICREHDYHNFVFSMKSSNPQVMVQAYRKLAEEMYKLGWDYPLHLGVTEAGGGADGRIKSAVGIGTLLLDGLGDTIRVSLTEDPEFEAAPCKALRQAAEDSLGQGVEAPFEEKSGRRELRFSRRKCEFPIDVPLNEDGTVITTMTAKEIDSLSTQALCDRLGLRLRKDGDVQMDWKSFDVVVVEGAITPAVGVKIKTLLDVPMGVVVKKGPNVPDGCTVIYSAEDVTEPLEERLGGYCLTFTGEESASTIEQALKNAKPRFALFKPNSQSGVTFLARRFFSTLDNIGSQVPVMLWFRYPAKEGQDEDDLVVQASSEFGSIFVDGMGNGILWDAESMSPDMLRESSFNLLQAARMRISKTEFISCPSCGRTLFDLQTTTAKIQERTGHLPGVRIAVMGCIVNGPGEMADADFGYVGSGIGKIDLYVNYDVVKRGIPSEDAVEALVDLIKEHGKWKDPSTGDEDEVESEELGVVASASF
mmetsp:Transcript_69735/g.167416  ORF Transcript_69735/g.167416 Transcript_69735/m.167416 type:complete len:791 (-) Transcript_69735:223-2595(-)|eukprot:CAMPEP_0178418440 /NCGR_PEP_ID=MMETSP0689_2-20121128/25088_1 /TAXON_ID=160604 /ORGANISM="Amphidinium massartii, Strain CS-259" /LENGTH=790 /DNA_ID=CAMNT_0020039831 /DNA_START=42 /DNA_END=2414 /DNA_ORIENTATION=+